MDIYDKVGDLNGVVVTNPPANPAGPLETLWEQCPSIFQALPFMGNDAQTQAAKAYLYSAPKWLEEAEKAYPIARAGGEYQDGVNELAANIVKVRTRVQYLQGLGYTATLDGVTGAAAELARKTREGASGLGLGLGLGAAAVVGLVVLVILLR